MKNYNADDFTDSTEFVPHVLVETKKLHHREFSDAWLLKIEEARSMWKELLKETAYKASWPWMSKICLGNFGKFLISSIERRREEGVESKQTVAIFNSEISPMHYWAEFPTLVKLGFFILVGDFYHPSMPENFTKEAVHHAAEKVKMTATYSTENPEDDGIESLLHVLTKDEVDEVLSL
ncbi:hypothetical protein [Bradyrhizobium sp. OAE829]|uniref:hypothetical protein n=1 Tax=Bradyrhizobium sp. OAE829 TaxID=2663807 RepID=UPI00178BCFE7